MLLCSRVTIVAIVLQSLCDIVDLAKLEQADLHGNNFCVGTDDCRTCSISVFVAKRLEGQTYTALCCKNDCDTNGFIFM